MAHSSGGRRTLEGTTAHPIAVGPSRPRPRTPAVRRPALCLAIPTLRIGCYAYPVIRWRCSGGSMLRAQRHTHGSVRFDKRRKTWNYLWYEAGKRRSKRIGNKREYPTKSAAWKAVEGLEAGQPKAQDGDTMRSVVARYEVERMPQRHSTARV